MKRKTNQAKARILYVDDDKGNLSGFRHLFQQYYDIHLAESAEHGLALLREHEFDVVLADQRMPVMRGTELLERVRALYPHPFRMIVTGYSDIQAVIEAINQGHIYYYFSKPWNEHEIKTVINHALEAIALERRNAQLWSDLKRSNKALKRELKLRNQTEEVLNARIRQQASAAEISGMILAASRLEDLMQKILRNVAETLSADSCNVLELQPDGVTLVLRACYGWSAGDVGKVRVRIDVDSPIGLTVRLHQPITFENLNVDERFIHVPLVLRDHGMVSGACVIIPGGAGVWGALSVQSRERQHFSADDVNYLQVVAKILGDAIAASASQETLQRSEQMMRRYYDAGLVGMSISTLEQGWIQVNDTFSQMLGYTREELQGMDWTKIIHPEELSAATAQYNRLLAGEVDGYTRDSRYLHKDGRVVPVTVSIKCARKQDGSIDYVVAFIQDISERKRMEEALRSNEARLREAAKLAHFGYWEHDYLTDESFWSDEIYAILECQPGSVKPSREKFIESVHADDRAEVLRTVMSALNSGNAYSYTCRIVRPSGEIRYLYTQGGFDRDASGAPRRTYGTMMDVTELKRAEEKINVSEKRLREAQHIAHLGYWEEDRIKGEDYWSDELYAILGLDPKLTMPSYQAFFGVIHPEDQPFYERFVQSSDSGEIQIRIVRRDGETRYLHLKGNLERDANGTRIRSNGTIMDITELKRAEETININEKRLREAQRLAQLGFWEWEVATSKTYWSDEMYALCGMDRETFQLSHESIIGLVHPDDRADYKGFFRSVLHEGFMHDYEHRIVLLNGEIRFHNVHAELIHGQDGAPVRVHGTVIDVTDRRRAEEAVKQSEHRLREAQRLARLGFWELDLATDKVFWSDELYALTGLDPKTFRLNYESIASFVPAEDLKNYEEFFEKVLRDGSVHGFEHRVLTPDGRMRYHNVHGELIRAADGAPVRILGTVLDVTERRQAQEDLRRAHDELEQRVEERTMELYLSTERAKSLSAIADTTLQNMGQGIIMVNADDRILIYNDLLQKYTGVPREQAMACGSLDEYLLLYKSIAGEENFLRDAQYCRMRERIAFEMTTLDGQIIEVRQNPLMGGGFVRTYTDITQLKQIQADYLVAKEKAEAANVAKANFLATMSHEIRTPMNGVIGMTDLLLQTRLDDEQREMLQTINDCGQSLLTIINDVLDFSKIEAGKLELEAIPMSLTDVVEGSAQTIVHNAIRKGLRLLTYVDPDLPQFVTGDPVRLRQILINLGGNAIKFTDAGKVMVRADRIVDNKTGPVVVRFSVIDEGIGISREAQRNLFKVFSQAESSTTRRYGGTGLGLSICQRLAEMMDGEIGVHSNAGQGSEFYVNLMFKPCDKVRRHSNVSDLAGLRILQIVPDAVERDIYRHYLEHWHAQVDTHADLAACLELCRAAATDGRPYQIVIVSPQWSVEQQLEASRTVMEAPDLSDTRFVLMKRGRRRRPRLENGGCVTLDVDQMRRSSFLSAVSIAAGRASPEVDYDAQMEEMQMFKSARAPSREQAQAQGRLILVAEDNPTNRDVIRRQLNVLGYACEMVDDGKQALAAWHGKRYALLLTDCQMPSMDGFELTNHIRREEESTAMHTIIIAITANALKGEAERCLAAGMDDYLPKPIDMKDLRDKLRQWLPQPEDRREFNSEQTAARDPIKVAVRDNPGKYGGMDPIDERALKTTFGDNPETFKEILRGFIDPSQRIISEIEHGWKARCAKDINQAAHKLKSSARSIGAVNLADICMTLEAAGREENWDVIDEQVPSLNTLMQEIEKYISRL